MFAVIVLHENTANALRERAPNAPTSYRVVFEALERRFSSTNPDLLLLPNWDNFVGMATMAGCFTLSVCLAHEVPPEIRTELEMIMRKAMECRYPGADAYWEDLARYVSDAFSRIPRSERGKYIFLLPAFWLAEHLSESRDFPGKDELCGKIAMFYQDESVGYWKAAMDYFGN